MQRYSSSIYHNNSDSFDRSRFRMIALSVLLEIAISLHIIVIHFDETLDFGNPCNLQNEPWII